MKMGRAWYGTVLNLAHIQKGELQSVQHRQLAKHDDKGTSQDFKSREKHNQKLLHKNRYLSLHVQHMDDDTAKYKQ